MRTWAKGSARTALLTASFVALGAGTAFADTSGNNSVGGGNQLNLPISIPIELSGNAVAAAGESAASSKGGATVANKGTGSAGSTSGNSSVLGGNQVTAPISAPVNACGNAISLFGNSDAGCKGGASVKNSGVGGGGTTNGNYSLLGGNQVVAPISAPINACGNAIAIFGESGAGCKGGSSVKNTGSAGGGSTSGKNSLGGGNQITAPISGPINICGNAIAIFGEAFAGCKGGASVENNGGSDNGHRYTRQASHSDSGNETDGTFSGGGGNQVLAPVSLPVNICGNAGGNAPAGCKGGSSVKNSGAGAGGNTTSGKSSVLGGNQVVAPITAPVNICGNAVALAGEAFAGCKGGASVKNAGAGAGGNTTSGKSSVLGGNQVVAPITAPINACGNAVAALGASEADCKGGAHAQGGTGGGGNTTSGKSSVLGGNQVVAPITAPINVCGNAVAVLGDAAAGCLGGAGTPGDNDGYHSRTWGNKTSQAAASGLLPALPIVPGLPALSGLPALPGAPGAAPMKAAGLPDLPVVGDLQSMLGLPELPSLPGLPDMPATAPLKPGKAAPAAPSLPPVGDVAKGLPISGVTSSLPVDLPGLGLMSASQPTGVSGMTSGALFALVIGALLALGVTLSAASRRIRLGRR